MKLKIIVFSLMAISLVGSQNTSSDMTPERMQRIAAFFYITHNLINDSIENKCPLWYDLAYKKELRSALISDHGKYLREIDKYWKWYEQKAFNYFGIEYPDQKKLPFSQEEKFMLESFPGVMRHGNTKHPKLTKKLFDMVHEQYPKYFKEIDCLQITVPESLEEILKKSEF